MRVVLDATSSATTNGWVVLRVTSINDEAQQVTWPARLHLSESMISILVDDVRHRGAEQIDSIPETVVLEPGQAVSTGVLVSVSDRGPVLSTPGEVMVQVSIFCPSTAQETLSNSVVIAVTDRGADDDHGNAELRGLHRAAVQLRDGESTDDSTLVHMLGNVTNQDRAWVATALLPAAPLHDDPLLVAARQLVPDAADARDTNDASNRLAAAIVHALPYDPE